MYKCKGVSRRNYMRNISNDNTNDLGNVHECSTFYLFNYKFLHLNGFSGPLRLFYLCRADC